MDSDRYRRRPLQPRRHQPRIDIAVPGRRPAASLRGMRSAAIKRRAAKRPARRLPPLDMSLPGAQSLLHSSQIRVRKSRWQLMRARGQRTAAVLGVVVLGLVVMLFSQGYFRLHQVFKGNASSAASLTENVDPNLLKGEGDGRVNVLLLGRGGGAHEAPDLTDTIILASIDPVNHTAALLSIPRDLWVDVPNQGAMKINAAWETGEFKYLGRVAPGSTDPLAIQAGFAMADQVVESVLGVPIHYNALVDFKAFQKAIDTVNGVTVNVPTDLIDPTMAWENNYNPVLAKAGIQVFDGKKALMYVRSRETSSDFARSQRQRAVMVALKDKAITLGTLSNPIKIAGLVDAFGDNVQTDLSLKDATRMYSIMKRISDKKVASIGLADDVNKFITTGAMAGQSVAYPTAGLFNYSDIQTFVRTKLPDGYIIKEKAKIIVLNGTNNPTAAETKAAELRSYGYNVVSVANAPTTNYAKTKLIKLSHDKKRYKYTANYLEKRLHTKAISSLPDKLIKPNGANFVIIVGSDEATSR